MIDSPLDPAVDPLGLPIAPTSDAEPTEQLADVDPQAATTAVNTELSDLGLALAYIVAGVGGQTVVYIDPAVPLPVAVDVPDGASLTVILTDPLTT